MSVYFEKARELGQLILCSERALRLSDADAAFQASPDSQAKMDEFKAYQMNAQQKLQRGSVTEKEVNTVSERLAAMANDLKRDPVIGNLIMAENDYNAFVDQVIGVIKATAGGSPDVDLPACGSAGHCRGCH